MSRHPAEVQAEIVARYLRWVEGVVAEDVREGLPYCRTLLSPEAKTYVTFLGAASARKRKALSVALMRCANRQLYDMIGDAVGPGDLQVAASFRATLRDVDLLQRALPPSRGAREVLMKHLVAAFPDAKVIQEPSGLFLSSLVGEFAIHSRVSAMEFPQSFECSQSVLLRPRTEILSDIHPAGWFGFFPETRWCLEVGVEPDHAASSVAETLALVVRAAPSLLS